LFLPPPSLSEKRRIKSARPQEKRQEDPGVLFMKTRRCPSVSFYEGVATLRRETKESSARKGRKLHE